MYEIYFIFTNEMKTSSQMEIHVETCVNIIIYIIIEDNYSVY